MMLWEVSDAGRVEIRLRAQGTEVTYAKVASDQLIGNIINDLAASLSINVITDELRYSFSKTRPEVTVLWRTSVPADRTDEVRAYLAGLAETMQ